MDQEIFYGNATIELLGKRKLVTVARSHYVLVEFNIISVLTSVKDFVDGRYIPVITDLKIVVCLCKRGKLGELSYSSV